MEFFPSRSPVSTRQGAHAANPLSLADQRAIHPTSAPSEAGFSASEPASAIPSAYSSFSGFTQGEGDSDQETEQSSTINRLEPWRQAGGGGVVAPRTFVARFFATRLGMMRWKCRRMIALTSERLYVLRVEDSKVKTSYPIKSVQLLPTEKSNQGKGFILQSEIGSVRHQFKCRDRTSLLTAFLDLQDAARDRPLNTLFQVIKRSKTRGDVKMTLRVGPTSLDRVDGERLQHRVSSLPLLSIERVYLFADDATQMLLDCTGGRRRRYWCSGRDSLVRAMQENLRKLGKIDDEETLKVERVGTWEVDTSTRSPESVRQGYLFEVPVLKWSRAERSFKARLLALTKSSLVEMEVSTREHLREFPLSVIFNIVYRHGPNVGNESEGDDLTLEVQMAWGGSSSYTFQACRCTRVSGDSILAFVPSADRDLPLDEGRRRGSDERRRRGSMAEEEAGAGEGGVNSMENVCGFHDLRLTAQEARTLFLGNFLEVCRLNQHGCPWSLRPITTESRVGSLTKGLHPDYQEFLLKRMTALGEAIARSKEGGPSVLLANPEVRAHTLAVVGELNASVPIAFRHKEKGAASAVLSLLSPSSLEHFAEDEKVTILLAALRLLWSKAGYEEVTRVDSQPAIDGVFECLDSKDHTVSYTAALV
ncbi:unnamed protein product, partial [Discosporangium mesarthrocarpum]